MSDNKFISNVQRYIQRWNGSTLQWDIGEYRQPVTAIREEQLLLKKNSFDELTEKAQRFREEVVQGKETDALLVQSFGLAAEVICRVLHLDPFDEQLIGGIVLHQGKCAQMQTGEGKTLAAVFPAFLNALSGNGVHIFTFNDYLAQRDAEWMGPVYRKLGCTVGYVKENMNQKKRYEAYRQDITYITAKEAGFDFLRDNCCYNIAHTVQRNHHFVIVDEADSILIDEARIPLIIASSTGTPDEHLTPFAQLARQMKSTVHFFCDAYGRKLHLTDAGVDLAERQLGCDNIYSSENGTALACLYHALHAEFLLHNNIDYLVRNNRIELIDELTGRIAENRRWPDSLHAAVETKEGCPVQPRGAVLSSITMHHFTAHYRKIAGMTATAECAEEELHNWYGLDTVIIPPHRKCIRHDHPDMLYATKKDKNEALVNEIQKVHDTGQPVLVGTRTVEESETLAASLKTINIDCRVLNAKDNSREASIIAEAGALGAVTISTNMAGRGTDIKLGGSGREDHEAVAARGGLYVIGTNRFESRRIDDQLRGRSGRQGDPGASRFFISLEDDLFEKYRIRELIPQQYIVTGSNGRIENRYVTTEVNRLQRIIEGQNGDIKFTLGKYTLILERQRTIVAEYRRNVLYSESLPEIFTIDSPLRIKELATGLGNEKAMRLCKTVLLREIDGAWSMFLADMSDLRDGIHLRRFGNQDPLFEFNRLAIDRFSTLLSDAERCALKKLSEISPTDAENIIASVNSSLNPSATWTYMVTDNPFEDRPEITLGSNMGYSAFAGLLWPLMALMLLFKKRKKAADRSSLE